LKEELQSSIQKGLDFVKPQHTWISLSNGLLQTRYLLM
jgi:hypothetical protein